MWKYPVVCLLVHFLVPQQDVSAETTVSTSSTQESSTTQTNRLNDTNTQTPTSTITETTTNTTTATNYMETTQTSSCNLTDEIRNCFMKHYGVQKMEFSDLNFSNVLEACRKRIYLDYCVDRTRFSCGMLDPIDDLNYLWFESVCDHIADTVAILKCQENYENLTKSPDYSDCFTALMKSDYNNATLYKKAVGSDNTCVFEQLKVKCEALVIHGRCMSYFRNYHYLMDVYHAERLKKIGCDDYVDIPCLYKLAFANDVCGPKS